jgi:hypothetical protein
MLSAFASPNSGAEPKQLHEKKFGLSRNPNFALFWQLWQRRNAQPAGGSFSRSTPTAPRQSPE